MIRILLADSEALLSPHALGHSNGLLASQASMRQSSREPNSFPRSGACEGSRREEKLKPPWEKPPGTFVTAGLAKVSSHKASGPSSKSSTTVIFEPRILCLVVTYLMAGAIFCILIAFLLSLRFQQTKDSISESATETHQPSLQAPVLSAALRHMLMLLKLSGLLGIEMISGMEANAQSALDVNIVSRFPGLISWLANYVLISDLKDDHSRQVQSYLYDVFNNWKSSYVMQQSYHTLKAYFGCKEFVSIVPCTTLPNTQSKTSSFAQSQEQNIDGLSAVMSSTRSVPTPSESEDTSSSPYDMAQINHSNRESR
ncbi:hypothetical protein G7Y89_g9983 [Cudoniella acicularis]|uniref:Uncharacterized protein n=1 Tax=Cudoniella acicularis TaxID=354080 RepID=A0A8H4RF70_9HELO|nr:hypothetical protein G7Y89_g9983 [Cudoniella acicularis]